MTRNPPEGRTPEQIRAGNKRLGLILLVVVAGFFVAVVVKQWILSTS
ncbi:cytochrome oxidase small assembly protein [Burkholderia alba]|nr:cytochrome oxidase small assembly protein [Burkholderia alba]